MSGQWKLHVAALVFVSLLTSCATDPLPDYRYYRPSPPLGLEQKSLRVVLDTLEVGNFRADGVFGERPIVYSVDSEPSKLSQYHYQLWTDPPGAIIQRRFVDVLRATGIAGLVTERASPRAEPAQLTGMIERLERVKSTAGGPWRVHVTLRIRVEAHRASAPLLERTYRQNLLVEGDTIAESVDAFGRAFDLIAIELATDLARSKP